MRDNQCDSDVPLELLPVDALMYEDAISWRNLPGILGFIPSFFCSLRDGRRHEMGSLAHFEYLLRIESVLMNGGGVDLR